jgi:uncharacterized protein YjiS (DUF1127 family)
MNARSFDTPSPIRPSTPTTRKSANGTKTEATNQSLPAPSCSANALSGRTLTASANTRSAAKSAWLTGNRRSNRSPIGVTIAKLWSHWRDEREIRRAIRELSELDDHTLRDLGIRDRSEIEFTVRFCRTR